MSKNEAYNKTMVCEEVDLHASQSKLASVSDTERPHVSIQVEQCLRGLRKRSPRRQKNSPHEAQVVKCTRVKMRSATVKWQKRAGQERIRARIGTKGAWTKKCEKEYAWVKRRSARIKGHVTLVIPAWLWWDPYGEIRVTSIRSMHLSWSPCDFHGHDTTSDRWEGTRLTIKDAEFFEINIADWKKFAYHANLLESRRSSKVWGLTMCGVRQSRALRYERSNEAHESQIKRCAESSSESRSSTKKRKRSELSA